MHWADHESPPARGGGFLLDYWQKFELVDFHLLAPHPDSTAKWKKSINANKK